MQKLGATVDSFDISEEAIAKCREINPNAYVFDLLMPKPKPHMILLFAGKSYII